MQLTPVSERALLRRCNRALAPYNEVLIKTAARGKLRSALGYYYLLDMDTNTINPDKWVESFAIELGVMDHETEVLA